MTDTDVKSTPLAAKHVELGARMVPFAGWNMPVQYTGILDEHKAVRETCGIFDISHMGQFTVAGDSAAAWLNSMLTNDINKLNVGQGQYSVMLNDRAGVIDDLILYRMEPETFFVVVNASKIDEDFAWLSAHQPAGVTLENHLVYKLVIGFFNVVEHISASLSLQEQRDSNSHQRFWRPLFYP